MDLEKFFDNVNHDLLMSRVSRRVGDRRVLAVIRRYLQAGTMAGGVESPRQEGTPQGGPLSPLLSNILLDDLDKELEGRGHTFCRYADDCNIYVRSKRARGRMVVELYHGLFAKGRNSFVWRGQDSNGWPVASGVYYVKAKTDVKSFTHKLLLLK